MLRPQDTATRDTKCLSGMWDFAFDAEDRGQLLLAPGWTYLLAKSEHSFDAQWSGRDPRSAHPHFPNSSESEAWVHTTRVTARQPAEWGLMLAVGA